MINVSGEFKNAIASGRVDYLRRVTITLADTTQLVLTNQEIWNSGVSVEEAISSDDKFTALGSASIGTASIVINNIYDTYSEYDFTDAVLTIEVGLELSETTEWVPKGVFTVEEAIYNGSTITLSCLDNMHKFEVPYSNSLRTYPTTLELIVLDLCSVCGVSLATSSLNFPRKNFEISARPEDEATTCREVLAWCATIAGCFAKCNTAGQLELKWFDTDLFDDPADDLDGGAFDTNSTSIYTTGDAADGGTFNPWNTGYAADGGSFLFSDLHIISSIYNHSISVDDVVITQVSAEVKVESDETDEPIEVFSAGTPGYAIRISQNDFITETNAQDIVDYLGQQLIGLTFRKANITHTSDPTIEAGDCADVYDRKNNCYHILITRTDFKVGSSQTTVCGAETPVRNSATRFTEATKSYVELRKKLIEQKDTFEQMQEELAQRIANASGLYQTDVQQQGGGTIHYLHNKPLLNESAIRIIVSSTGITMTANGTSQSPTWYGLTVDGQMIASILTTIGVNADWIRSGTLMLGGTSQNAGLLEVYNANGVKIGEWSKNGAQITGQLTLDSDTVVGSIGDMIEFKMYNFDGALLRRFSGDGLRIKSKSNPKYSTYVSPDRTVCFANNTIRGMTSIKSKLASDEGESLYYIEDGTKLYHHIIAHGDAFGMALGKYSLDSAFPNDDTEVEIDFQSVFEDAVQVLIGPRGLAIGGGLINTSSSGAYDCYIGNSWGVWEFGYSSSSSRDTTSYGVFIDYRGAEIVLGGNRSSTDSHKIRYTTSGLVVNGNTVAYQSTSAKRYKHNIELLHDDDLDPHRLYDLKVKQFRYNVDVFLQYKDMYGETLPGFIAEDVAEIYPAAVIHNVESPDDIESWDERRIIPPMLSLIQEQHEQIEALTERVNQLEQLVNMLLQERGA